MPGTFNATNPVAVGLATKVDHYDRVFENTTGLYAGEMSIASQAALDFIFAASATQLGRLAAVANKVPKVNQAGNAWTMASGGTGFVILRPGDSSETTGTLSDRNNHPRILLDDDDVFAEWHAAMPFESSNLEVIVIWCPQDTASAQKVRLDVSFERLNAGFDLDSDSFASVQSVSPDVPAAEGALAYTTVSFTTAQIDGLLTGEMFRLRVLRDHDHADDDFTGKSIEIYMVIVREA